MIDNQTLEYYRRFRGRICLVGHDARIALKNARTLVRFRQAESDGRVRLICEEERESFADVYGEEIYEREKKYIERWGVWYVRTEILTPRGVWDYADSIGTCVYRRPSDPFDNSYVIDLMASALEQLDQVWEEACKAI